MVLYWRYWTFHVGMLPVLSILNPSLILNNDSVYFQPSFSSFWSSNFVDLMLYLLNFSSSDPTLRKCSCLLKDYRFFFCLKYLKRRNNSWRFNLSHLFLGRLRNISLFSSYLESICKAYLCVHLYKKNPRSSLRWFIEYETQCIELVHGKTRRYSTYSSVLHSKKKFIRR